MDADDLDYFEALLFEKLDEAQRELEQIGDATQPIAPDVSIGRLSRLDSMQMQEMALEQQRRLKKRIDELSEAKARIADGSYGRCTHCREPIEFSRLQARPEAVLCGRCLERYG